MVVALPNGPNLHSMPANEKLARVNYSTYVGPGIYGRQSSVRFLVVTPALGLQEESPALILRHRPQRRCENRIENEESTAQEVEHRRILVGRICSPLLTDIVEGICI